MMVNCVHQYMTPLLTLTAMAATNCLLSEFCVLSWTYRLRCPQLNFFFALHFFGKSIIYIQDA